MAAIEEKLRKRRDKIANATAEPTDDVVAGDTPVVADPVPAVAAEPAAPVAVADPVPAPIENFEQKFKTAQGIADKAGNDLREVRRELDASRAETARLQDLMAKQMETIDALIKGQKPAEPESTDVKPAASSTPAAPTLTEQDSSILEAYDGLPEVLSKMFVTHQQLAERENNLYAAILNELTGAVAPVREQVTAIAKTEEQRKAERLESDIDGYLKSAFPQGSTVPSCRTIANSVEFGKWIADATDIHGNSYVDIYNDAVTKTFDAKTAARIQREFLRDMGQNSAPAANQNSEPATTQIATHNPAIPAALEDQIAIGRSTGGDAPTGGKPKQTVTEDEVKKLGSLAWRFPTKENQEKYANALRTLKESITAAQKR